MWCTISRSKLRSNFRAGKFQKSLFEDHVIDTQTKVLLRSKLYTINVLWLDWKKIKKNLNTMGTIFERATKCPYSSQYKYIFLHKMKLPFHKHKSLSKYLIQINIRSFVLNIAIHVHIFSWIYVCWSSTNSSKCLN